MNIAYEHKPAMTFIGFSTSIRPEEGYQKCPEFWDREYAQKYARLWQTMKPAPVQTRTSLTVTVKFLGAPRRAGLSDREYWVLATQIGMWSRPKDSSS